MLSSPEGWFPLPHNQEQGQKCKEPYVLAELKENRVAIVIGSLSESESEGSVGLLVLISTRSQGYCDSTYDSVYIVYAASGNQALC